MKVEPFGYKNAWFACRTDSALAVASALRLTAEMPSSWEEGVKASYANEEPSYIGAVFVSPPIDGWVLAVGNTLFTLCDSTPPSILEWCANLSQALAGAEIHFFCTHRVVGVHAWGRAKDGRANRCYVFVDGEIHEDVGGQTMAEKSLGFNFFNDRSAEAEDENYYDREDLEYPDEDHVMRLAAAWSVDPSELEARGLDVAAGLLGRITLPEPKFAPKPAVIETAVIAPRTPSEAASEVGSPKAVGRPWWRFW